MVEEPFDWEDRWNNTGVQCLEADRVAMMCAEVGLEPYAIDRRLPGRMDILWWNRLLSENEIQQIVKAMSLISGVSQYLDPEPWPDFSSFTEVWNA